MKNPPHRHTLRPHPNPRPTPSMRWTHHSAAPPESSQERPPPHANKKTAHRTESQSASAHPRLSAAYFQEILSADFRCDRVKLSVNTSFFLFRNSGQSTGTTLESLASCANFVTRFSSSETLFECFQRDASEWFFPRRQSCASLLIFNSSQRNLRSTPPRLISLQLSLRRRFMSQSDFLAQARQHLAVGVSLVALVSNLGAPLPATAQSPAQARPTASPIQHVIVIIGENRSFDHVFATYQPKGGQTISNLLSKG